MQNAAPPEVEGEYRALLAREGLEHLLATESPFATVDAELRATITASGVDLPEPTYVGEFPHRSLHAQARAVPGGTLILLDTGLRTLLDSMAVTTVASQLTFTRDEAGKVRHEVATPQQHRRRAEADTALAAAIVAYVCQVGARPAAPPRAALDPPSAFGIFLARSAERFAIGHEYGHLLAGHRHTPPESNPESMRRECEADELAALLIMRGLDESTQFIWRVLAVAGPFFFLAVEHLVARVRQEITDLARDPIAPTHPPSDARATQLRGIVAQLGERNLLQLAEAWASSLALREPTIVRNAHQSVRS